MTTDENIDRIYRTVMDDRRLTVRYIASVVGISQERVEYIRTYEPEMTKV